MRPTAPRGVHAAVPLALLALLALLAGCAGGPPHPGIGAPVHASFDRAAPGPLQAWQVVQGNWSIVEDGSAPSPPNAVEGAAGAQPAVVLVPDQAYDEVDASVQVRAHGAAGLVVRDSALTGRSAAVLLDAANRTVVLARGDDAGLHGVPAPVPNATGWHALRVSLRGGHASVLLDGAPVLSADLEMPSQGSLGMIVLPGGDARFDELAVEPAR
jgi:hypothetical protein